MSVRASITTDRMQMSAGTGRPDKSYCAVHRRHQSTAVGRVKHALAAPTRLGNIVSVGMYDVACVGIDAAILRTHWCPRFDLSKADLVCRPRFWSWSNPSGTGGGPGVSSTAPRPLKRRRRVTAEPRVASWVKRWRAGLVVRTPGGGAKCGCAPRSTLASRVPVRARCGNIWTRLTRSRTLAQDGARLDSGGATGY